MGQTGKGLNCISFLAAGAEVLKSYMLVFNFKKPQKPLLYIVHKDGFHSTGGCSPSGCSVFSQTCPGAATWPQQTAPIPCCGQGSGLYHTLLPSFCSSLIFPLIPLPHVTNKQTLLLFTQLTAPSCCALRLCSTVLFS